MHSATKVSLASIRSNIKDVSCHAVDPASFVAGIKVYMGSDGLPTLTKGSNMPLGVSLGRSLSDHKKLDVGRTGMRVPMRAHLKRSTASITITNVANLVSGTDDAITIGGTALTAQAGAATPGDATFQATGSTSATATSLATQINAHATISTKVYAVANAAIVTLYAVVEGAGVGNDVSLTYTDNDTNIGATVSAAALAGGSDTISDIAYMTVGTKAYINNATGKLDIAMTGFSTVSDAMYFSSYLTGIDEDNVEVAAALVDMPGGL